MGPGFESLIAYEEMEVQKTSISISRTRSGIRTLDPLILKPFFSLLRKRVALRAISFAYSLRPNTLEPALFEDIQLAGGGAL